MTENPSLREEDRLILQQIQEGNDDVQKITENTLLENHQVNYAFQKLEEHSLIHVTKPEGYTERTINGQKRVFQHPKQAELTDKGEHYPEKAETQDLDDYENLSHRELVEKIHNLENQVNTLEKSFEVFKNQIIQKIE